MSNDKLIGKHPSSDSILGEWFSSIDISFETTKKHRSLTVNDIDKSKVLEELSRLLIDYHVHPKKRKKLVKLYEELGFKKYSDKIKDQKLIPSSDKTRKGNFGEIVLSEYLKKANDDSLLDIFRLHYNPNIEQSMKGDDVLLFKIESNVVTEIYLGESKFRAKVTKTAVDDIVKNLSESKTPISLSFVESTLYNLNQDELAEAVGYANIKLIKSNNKLKYLGIVIGGSDCESMVSKHLKTTNENLAIISISFDNPQSIVDDSFEFATQIIKDSPE